MRLPHHPAFDERIYIRSYQVIMVFGKKKKKKNLDGKKKNQKKKKKKKKKTQIFPVNK